MEALSRLGWDEFFAAQLTDAEKQGNVVARVVEPLRGLIRVAGSFGEVWAEGIEKLPEGTGIQSGGIAIGDWIVGTPRSLGNGEKRISLLRVLNRKTKLSRSAPAGKGYEQILCANAEVAFLVLALTQELNVRGVERYLSMVRASGLEPVMVLTKADDCPNREVVLKELANATKGVPVHVVSVKEKTGLAPLHEPFRQGKTVVLLGASGAGKSTLANYFTGTESQKVEGVRESDQKGRHTTTGRRLFLLPASGMLIDSPGIREVQPWVERAAPPPVKEKKKSKAARRPRHFDREE